MTPEEWFNPQQRELKDMFNMMDGNMLHHVVQELLQRNYKEEKRTWEDFDITLVGKADYLPTEKDGVPEGDEVWEFKSSNKLMSVAKPWHLHQTKLYCSMFGKKTGKIFQPIRSASKIQLKLLGTVNRDDLWFMEEMRKLEEFHKKVDVLWLAQNK